MANLKDLIVNGSARVLGTIFGNLTGNVTGNCSGSSGSCTGNAATATKATQDGSGNVITSTYVNLTGSQTVTGAKTFQNTSRNCLTINNSSSNSNATISYYSAGNKLADMGIKSSGIPGYWSPSGNTSYLVRSDESGVGSVVKPVHINAYGMAQACTYEMDIPWVFSTCTIASGANARTSDTSFDLRTDPADSTTPYLPDDGYVYELIITSSCSSGATSGNYALVAIKTDVQTSAQAIIQAQTRSSSAVNGRSSIIIPIGPARTLTVVGYTSNTGTYSMVCLAYRRIGK